MSRWTSQLCRSPKLHFHFRSYFYSEEQWTDVLDSGFNFVRSVDKLLGEFFRQDFSTNNVNVKKNKLDAGFRAAVQQAFPEEMATKMLKSAKVDPKNKDFLLRRVPEIVSATIDAALQADATKFANFSQLVAENVGRDLRPIHAENIFQSSLNITGMEIKNDEPTITSYKLLSEQFTGNLTMSMAELFSSGIIIKIHDDVRPELWSFFVKNLVHDSDFGQVYPVLNRMIRKNRRKTARNAILPLCDLMLKVNPRFEGNFVHFVINVLCPFLQFFFPQLHYLLK